MKTVFSNSQEVCHIFANQTQSEGRNSSHNIYFRDKNIYSYDSPYLLGEFRSNYKNEKYLIINDSGYSNTTSKHIYELRSASSHLITFNTSITNFKNVLTTLKSIVSLYLKERKPEKYIYESSKLIESLGEYIEFMGKKWLKADKEQYALYKEIIKLNDAVKDKEQYVSDFRSGLISYIPRFLDLPCMLRLRNDFVETSENAKVSVKSARVLYNLLQANKDIVGANIDGFTVRSISEEEIIIGCHNIPMSEVLNIGSRL